MKYNLKERKIEINGKKIKLGKTEAKVINRLVYGERIKCNKLAKSIYGVNDEYSRSTIRLLISRINGKARLIKMKKGGIICKSIEDGKRDLGYKLTEEVMLDW